MKKIALLIFFLCFVLNGFTQANWEVNFVRNANPQNPNNAVFKGLSSTAKPLAVALPVGMWAIAMLNKNKKGQYDAYETAASVAIAAIATQTLKVIVQRPRPYQTYPDIYPNEIDNGQAFPSGHASVAFAAATSVSLIYKKWYITVPALAWATAVGYSRIYLGQHYPSDILAAGITGAASAYASHWLQKKIFKEKKKAASPKL